MTDILMPKATAVWLVDNTSLTFEQIADFCGLHPLEVRGIADGDVARDIRGVDPITGGQLAREELDKAQAKAPPQRKAGVDRSQCEARDRRIQKIDQLARRGGTVQQMERLREERQEARDWQFRAGC